MIDTADRKSMPAAFWSAMIIAAGAIAVTGYVEDNRLIVAAMIGAFLGTYTTLKYKTWKECGQDKTTEKDCAEKAQS